MALAGRQTPVLVVSGYSNSGKTTLIEGLVPELRRRGYRVGVIKHLGSDLDLDRPGKDSHRFWQSGAEAVGLLAPDRTLVMWRDGGLGLAGLAGLMDVDLVLAEGFRESPEPAIVVTGDHPEAPGEQAHLRPIVAVVGGPPEGRWPRYDVGDIAGVADRVEEWLASRGGG